MTKNKCNNLDTKKKTKGHLLEHSNLFCWQERIKFHKTKWSIIVLIYEWTVIIYYVVRFTNVVPVVFLVKFKTHCTDSTTCSVFLDHIFSITFWGNEDLEKRTPGFTLKKPVMWNYHVDKMAALAVQVIEITTSCIIYTGNPISMSNSSERTSMYFTCRFWLIFKTCFKFNLLDKQTFYLLEFL